MSPKGPCLSSVAQANLQEQGQKDKKTTTRRPKISGKQPTKSTGGKIRLPIVKKRKLTGKRARFLWASEEAIIMKPKEVTIGPKKRLVVVDINPAVSQTIIEFYAFN